MKCLKVQHIYTGLAIKGKTFQSDYYDHPINANPEKSQQILPHSPCTSYFGSPHQAIPRACLIKENSMLNIQIK